MNPDGGLNRDKLQAEANVLRAQLGRTLAVLAQRWHHAFILSRPARRHPLPILLAGAGLAGGIGILVHRFQHRKRRLRADRLRALVRSWQHPRRVARSNTRALGMATARWLVTGTTASVLIWLAKGALTIIAAKLRHQARERPS